MQNAAFCDVTEGTTVIHIYSVFLTQWQYLLQDKQQNKKRLH